MKSWWIPVSDTHLDGYKRQDYSYEIQKKAAQQNQNVDTGKSALNITDKANNYVKAYAESVSYTHLFLIKDETSSLKGNLSDKKDVDFYNFSIPFNRTIQNYFGVQIYMDIDVYKRQ